MSQFIKSKRGKKKVTGVIAGKSDLRTRTRPDYTAYIDKMTTEELQVLIDRYSWPSEGGERPNPFNETRATRTTTYGDPVVSYGDPVVPPVTYATNGVYIDDDEAEPRIIKKLLNTSNSDNLSYLREKERLRNINFELKDDAYPQDEDDLTDSVNGDQEDSDPF
jgi:hypothetical protein